MNGNWIRVYDLINGGGLEVKSGNIILFLIGEQKFRFYILVFGRDVKNGMLIFEVYNGIELVDRQVFVKNFNIDYFNEIFVEVIVKIL